jgi:hypothetical protein
MAIFQVANCEMTWGLPPRCQKIITGTAYTAQVVHRPVTVGMLGAAAIEPA